MYQHPSVTLYICTYSVRPKTCVQKSCTELSPSVSAERLVLFYYASSVVLSTGTVRTVNTPWLAQSVNHWSEIFPRTSLPTKMKFHDFQRHLTLKRFILPVKYATNFSVLTAFLYIQANRLPCLQNISTNVIIHDLIFLKAPTSPRKIVYHKIYAITYLVELVSCCRSLPLTKIVTGYLFTSVVCSTV